MTGIKLYEATEALAIIDGFLEESQGEITPEIEALLEQAEGTFAAKVERVALKIRELTGAAEIIKAEEERLSARRRAHENAAKGLKTYLQRQLEVAGKDKVKGELLTVATQLNPPVLQVPADTTDADLAELYEAGMRGIEQVPATFAVNKREVLDMVRGAEANGKTADTVLPAGWTVTRSSSLRIR